MSFLWVAFYVLLALFMTALLLRTVSRLARQSSASPFQGTRSGRGITSAREAHAAAGAGEHVIGWQVPPEDRNRLLSRCPPRYANTVADHITLKAHVAADAPLPPERQAVVVGRADDGRGVEALVVRVGSGTERPDGGTYHITWSLAEGREAQESNDVIAATGWEPLQPPIAIHLQPQSFPRSGKAPSPATAN
jgi:hypothetical protein